MFYRTAIVHFDIARHYETFIAAISLSISAMINQAIGSAMRRLSLNSPMILA
jgi:hypothetical protein